MARTLRGSRMLKLYYRNREGVMKPLPKEVFVMVNTAKDIPYEVGFFPRSDDPLKKTPEAETLEPTGRVTIELKYLNDFDGITGRFER